MSLRKSFHITVLVPLLLILHLSFLVHPAASLTPSKRIIGGNATSIKDHLEFASITLMDVPICGAAIVTSTSFITSASCVYFLDLSLAKVEIGASTAGDGWKYDIARLCFHPSFKFVSPYVLHDYDVAIGETRTQFSGWATTYKTIGIRSMNYDIPTGDLGVEVGYGTKGWGGPRNLELQSVALPRIRDTECIKYYPNLTDNMFCAGYRGSSGKDACATYGSPFVYENALSGVDSFSKGCAQPNIPRIYTRLWSRDIYNFIRSGRCT